MLAVFSIIGAAQSQSSMVIQSGKPWTIATGNNLYCAGYIQASGMSDANYIIGAVDEADKFGYGQNDFLWINMGSNKGVQVGDIFTVVRPQAQFKSKWSHKHDLGFLVREVGAVEVVSVKANHSAVRIKTSCDAFYLGDLVQLVERRTSPMFEPMPPLDLFADPSGKATGRVLTTRDQNNLITRDFIVYVDLGADDGVKVGDRLTIYRTLGKGNPYNPPVDNEAITARDYGFNDEEYEGGRMSNQAPRKSGAHAGGHEMAIDEVKEGRPYLRKITGEAVVLNVKEKTATVVITRTASEIHPGDYVELQ